jgi:hypothetical protein
MNAEVLRTVGVQVELNFSKGHGLGVQVVFVESFSNG